VTTVFLGAKQELEEGRFSSNSWWRFTVGCRIIVYVLNGAVPSNVKRMSLIFKISKINLEYVAIFLTEIPQCLQRRHWGFLAFLKRRAMIVYSDSDSDHE
jgi:hypothetical protein